MPAFDLTEEPKTLSRYDVLGQRAESQTRFVKHVGLLDEDNQSVKMGDEVKMLHMKPPFEEGRTLEVHVAGDVPLKKDEIDEIEEWMSEIKDEYEKNEVNAWHQYIIRPPWKDEPDPNTGVRRYRRYSCAGFVLDAHRQVEIELLDIDEDVLPAVDRQTIISAYPGAEKHTNFLIWCGLEGNGPWKVVLAGYVLHALNRSMVQIRQEPYRAKEGDELF